MSSDPAADAIEQLARERDYWQGEAERYAQNVGHAQRERDEARIAEGKLSELVTELIEKVQRLEGERDEALREVEQLRAERMSSLDRDYLGQLVRIAWVQWAEAQEDPKPSWLLPWSTLPEHYKEADRCIGEFVAARCVMPELLRVEQDREKLRAALARTEAENAGLRLLKDMDVLTCSVFGTFLQGKEIPETIDRTAGVLLKRLLKAEAEAAELSRMRVVFAENSSNEADRYQAEHTLRVNAEAQAAELRAIVARHECTCISCDYHRKERARAAVKEK